MLFFLFALIKSISFLASKEKLSSQSSTSYFDIVDFSKFQPQIAIRIVLYGFLDDNSFLNSFKNILERFLSSKRFGVPSTSSANDLYINVSLTYSINIKNNDRFLDDYLNLIRRTHKTNNSDEYFHVAQDSEFTNIFSNLHANEILRSKAHGKLAQEKYTLIFVNHSTLTQFQYENSKELTNCLIFEFNSGFCHIGPTQNIDDDTYYDDEKGEERTKLPINNKNVYLTKLFKYTSVFVEQVIIPDLLDYNNQNFLITPSKVIVPIVTFGPDVRSLATLQKEITSLFSPIESLLIVNRQNLYEFPLVATALQSKIGSNLLFTALGQSEHIFGTSLGTAILRNDENYRRWREKMEKEEEMENKGRWRKKKDDYLNFTETVSSINRRKVTPIYVFNSRDDRTNNLYFNLNNNNFHFTNGPNEDNSYLSAIFADEKEKVDKLILSSITKVAGNINFLNTQVPRYQSSILTSSHELKRLLKKEKNSVFCAFGGHHPFFPYGGVRSFSSIFSDVIIRNFALSNILVSFKNFVETQKKLDQLRRNQLPFLNASLNIENLKILQKMLVRTSDRINKNEVAKALSSSSKAAEASIQILKEAEELVLESSVFGNCCPETVYVSKNINNVIVTCIVVSFFIVVAYAFYKLYLLYKKKRITPKAFL